MSRPHNAREPLRRALGPLLAVVAALLLLAPATGAAQQLVRFGARVLLAGDAPPPPGIRTIAEPDQRLERFLPRLRQLFRYSQYTSLDRFRAEVPVGATQRWPVPGDRQLVVTPEAVTGQVVRLRVRLRRAALSEVDTSIHAHRGNPAVIGGPRHHDGVLIIIIWANANPDEPR